MEVVVAGDICLTSSNNHFALWLGMLSFGIRFFWGPAGRFRYPALHMISELKLEDAVLVGHSMGGVIATRLAAFEHLAFKGLVLSSTHLGFGKPKGEDLMPRYANEWTQLRKIVIAPNINMIERKELHQITRQKP